MNKPEDCNNGSFLCSWSGGKDSYYAFYKALQSHLKPQVLLNVLNEHGNRSRSHGIPKIILQAQAECLDLPIHFIESSWSEYEDRFIAKLKVLKSDYNCSHAVYGDIDIETHRAWEEKVSEAASLVASLPLWQQNRVSLVNEMIDLGIKPVIVSCRTELAGQILGKPIDKYLLKIFEELGIDACGENGEYHTLVVDGPLHKRPLEVELGNQVRHKDYAFIELSLL